MSEPRDETCCRLCGSKISYRYSLRMLSYLDVKYYECNDCHSLQTETPYWLEQAYSNSLTLTDTGSAQRNITNFVASYFVAKIFRFKNVLDFGGGDGFLCRLLRDYEINCYVTDKYAVPTYARAFTKKDYDSPDLLLSFEVFEHFANPGEDIHQLFELRPRAVILSTELYDAHSTDWWYLSPETGQHLFFYSRKAMEYIAKKYGYSSYFQSHYIVFLKKKDAGMFKTTILKFILKDYPLIFFRIILCLVPYSGLTKDFNDLRTQKIDGT